MPVAPNTPGNPWLVKGMLALIGITAVAAASLTFYGKSIDVQVDGIAATTTDGVSITNNTAATVGTAVQYSPRVRLRANVWDTDGAISDTWDWWSEAQGLSGTATTGQLKFYHSKNGAAGTSVVMFDSDGKLTVDKIYATTRLVITASNLTSGTMSADGGNPAVRTAWSKYTWTNAMVTALGAATSGDVTVCTLPAKTQVRQALIVITTAGTNMAAATFTATLGTDAEFDNFLLSANMLAAANTVYGDIVGEVGASLDATAYVPFLPSWTATTAVKVRFATDGAGGKTLADVLTSTGSVYLLTETLP